MTEKTWLQSRKPMQMLEAVRGNVSDSVRIQMIIFGRINEPLVRARPRVSDRKARLYAVACCRAFWNRRTDKRVRAAVESAEDFADGRVAKTQMNRAAAKLKAAARTTGGGAEWDAAREVTRAKPWEAAVMSHICATPPFDTRRTAAEANAVLSGLLRDIFGDPFRPTKLDRRWLTANVVDLARTIYEERAFDRLPILADALMDAGCADETILKHCRSKGPHVPGCWLVDLILGKP
jgi:hypothetical protein